MTVLVIFTDGTFRVFRDVANVRADEWSVEIDDASFQRNEVVKAEILA